MDSQKWTPIPSELFTPNIIKSLLEPDANDVRAYGRLPEGVLLGISGVYGYITLSGKHLDTYYRRTLAPVRLARECGIDVPLDIRTPAGIVADYLFDHGHEDADIYRLLMWFHELGVENQTTQEE